MNRFIILAFAAQRLASRRRSWGSSAGFAAPDKRRPVLILSRNSALAVLHTALVAPITSTIHGLPSEVALPPSASLKRASAINLDHMQCVRQRDLSQFVGVATAEQMHLVCRALEVAVGCDGAV